MPWCPKCKNEYRAGIRVCAECGCELIEEEKESMVPITFGAEDEVNTLRDFLLYSKLENVSVSYDNAEDVFVLRVDAQDENQAKKLVTTYLQQKALEKAESDAMWQDEPEEEETPSAPSGVYEDSAQKAEENRSSGLTLLGVGLIGLGIMVLGMTGVLPIRLSASTSYMVYGVMSALFILFIVMGVVSMRSSKIFAKKAESENSLRSTMEKWCLESLDAGEMDRELFGESAGELSSEMKYFRRTELLKKKIENQFMNLDVQFLEHFVDDVYGDIFEEE